MSTMCQACGIELAVPAIVFHCKICQLAFCQECEKNGPSTSNGEHESWCCKSCSEKQETSGVDSVSPYATPLLSPSCSTTSYHSCTLGGGDTPVDTNPQRRGFGAEDLDTGQKHAVVGLAEHSEKQEDGIVSGGSSTSVKVQDDSDGSEIAFDNTPYLAKIDTDPLIWIPPEPEDMEDEIMTVANNVDDDDDEYNEGTEWGQPSSLSCLSEDGNSYGNKEERQKVPHGEDAESWHDIVTSLSREAALLVKPYASEGRAMDLGSYVKIKCIASGTRSQSQVINGLVFKKNTTHKHMPTKFKNPRILLLKGALGDSAAGLSSLASMEEEDYLKSIIEMAESCHPNLVLVEKSVSRDIQESLVAKGITLVYDMKLPRLKRIAQCIGSQIISAADILTKPKLKQCGSFHIEKFVEEHNSSIERRKRPNETLMFLEGCPKPLGCTVLLKGAHIDELKKIKHLMQSTVFAAVSFDT